MAFSQGTRYRQLLALAWAVCSWLPYSEENVKYYINILFSFSTTFLKLSSEKVTYSQWYRNREHI